MPFEGTSFSSRVTWPARSPWTSPCCKISGDAAFAQASLDFGVGLALAGRTDEAISHTTVALSARTDLDNEEQLSAIGVYWVAQALAHYHAGHLTEAEGIGDAGYQISVEKNNIDGQAWFASILGLIHLVQGRLVECDQDVSRIRLPLRESQSSGRRWGLSGIALASSYLGDSPTRRPRPSPTLTMPRLPRSACRRSTRCAPGRGAPWCEGR